MFASIRFVLLLALCLAAAAGECTTLRWAVRAESFSLDPHATLDPLSNNLNGMIYETLVQRDREQKVVPRLATSWVLVDDLTWRFALRRDVRFSDGTPLTADDVVFSIERAQQPTSQWAWVARRMGKPVRIDDATIELRMAAPHSTLLEAAEVILIMSKAWCVANGAEHVPEHKAHEEGFSSRRAMGSGPYLLGQRDTLHTVLTRNPNWWGRFEGNVTEVIVTPIANDATRTAALLSGEIDFTHEVPIQDIPRLEQEAGVHLTTVLGNRLLFFGMDQSRDELLYSNVKGRNPFKDVRVREAFFRAVDADMLRTKIMRGHAMPTACMTIVPANCLVRELEKRPPVDVERARRLLAEAGYPDGFEVRLDCTNDGAPNDVQICTALVGMLARIGVTLKLEARPRAIHIPKIQSRNTSFYLFGWGGTATDPSGLMGAVLRSFNETTQRGGDNYGRYVDAELDRWIDGVAVEMNSDRRAQLIRDVLQRTYDHFYYLPIHRSMLTWASRANVRPVITPGNWVRVDWIQID